MNIDGAEEKVRKIDKLLTEVKGLLKKHWGVLLLILFCWFIYWALTTDPVETYRDAEQMQQEIINDTL